MRILFFLFFTSLLFSGADYIDYEDTYDSEAFYNVHIPNVLERNTSASRLEQLDEKIRKLEEKIHQVENGIWTPALQRKTIYLTFDDGPLQGTENVLSVLEEEKVPATFFFVGKHIERDKELFYKVKSSPYALVANHTYSHANGHYRQFYKNPKWVVKDIEKAGEFIEGRYQRLAGRNVWRLPSYHCNDQALKPYICKQEIPCYDKVENMGYYIFGWDLEWEFNQQTGRGFWSGTEMFKRAVHRSGHTVKTGKVVLLMHDFMFRGLMLRTRELQKLITLLKADDWQFDTIDNYL